MTGLVLRGQNPPPKLLCFQSRIMSISIYIKSGRTFKEAAITHHHLSMCPGANAINMICGLSVEEIKCPRTINQGKEDLKKCKK